MARSTQAASFEERLIGGRYRIEALLGEGGMGAVYAALDTSTGTRVALKRTFSSASPKIRELFRREFHTLHGLRHPNIIAVHEYGNDEDGLFYTMELLEGRDLSGAAPLPWRDVCAYLRQVATLLGLLHARRLLHRDISPRNLWVLPDGRLKLIDFGALGPFGVPTEIVGTPPFIAPEWLHDRSAAVSVDQRADLYGLGALAYWLLTSVHAYPARGLHDLPRIWAREPAPPSSLARLVEKLEPIPPELDVLVSSLLRLDPAARPANTESVITRIDAIAGTVREQIDHELHGYVRSKAFVGREAELQLLERHLRSERSEGRAILIEAAHGMGRSRLLEELAVRGQLAGAASVLISGARQRRAYGVANAIALRLLDCLPNDALASASPYASQLAQLSREMHRRLGMPDTPAKDASPQEREQLQQALVAWLLTLAQQRKLLLLIDDLEASDEESAAWLAALARSCGERQLLLVAALAREPNIEHALHIRMFGSAALNLQLTPLTPAEAYELLHSVFGAAAYLSRVSETLQRVSQGNPAHCLELVEHLVETGAARLSEGSWTLPGQLQEEALPRSRGEMHASRLSRVGDAARRLAEQLSIHDGLLSRTDCLAVAESSAADAEAALVELTLSGVLIENDQGYGFAHDGVRETLLAGLSGGRRSHAHAKLAAALWTHAADPIDGLHVALHLLHAGDTARADQLVREAVKHLFAGNRSRMQAATPLLEEVVLQYRATQRGLPTLAAPLAALAMASFFVDRRLADRYGIAALETLEQLLCFDRARALRRYLGPKLALFAALAESSVRRRRNRPSAPSVAETMRMLFGSVVALNAVATSGFDLATTERCHRAFEPLAGLSENDVAGFIRVATLAIAGLLTERHTQSMTELRRLVTRAQSDPPIRNLPDPLKKELLAGGLFSIGLLEAWRQSPSTLEIANQIEPYSSLAALNADHLRNIYYAGLGDTVRAALYRQRVEMRALQLGAAWQVVTLGPIDDHVTSLWTQDALLAKRAAAELERLSRELPSLTREARRARATYLTLCGRYREAIDIMQTDDSPRWLAGWSRTQGILARAHNRLGEHERARELCLAALAGRSETDLDFVVMNLHVQLELALSNAALGNFGRARAHIDRLLARHATSTGPLLLGALHETRARVALIERDLEAASRHCASMRSCYAPTQIPSLLELTAQLEKQLRHATDAGGEQSRSAASLLGDDAHLITRMHLILSHGAANFELRALHIALELTGASAGFVLSAVTPANPTYAGEQPPDPELVRWACSQLAGDSERTALATDATLSTASTMTCGHLCYSVIRLPANDTAAPTALVLGFEGKSPRSPSHEALALLASHMR